MAKWLLTRTTIEPREFMGPLLEANLSEKTMARIFYSTLVILLKATKDKSQNRISLKQQRILKNDKSESFLNFYLVYKYVCLKIMR